MSAALSTILALMCFPLADSDRSLIRRLSAASAFLLAALPVFGQTLPRPLPVKDSRLPEVAVKLAPGQQVEVFAMLKSRKAKAVYPGGWGVIQAASIQEAEHLASLWRSTPGVVLAAVNRLAHVQTASFVPDDTYFAYNSTLGSRSQWYLANTSNIGGNNIDARLTPAWNSDWTGEGIKIGIIDDGFDIDHEDLADSYDSTGSYDFYGIDSDPSASFSDETHGTAVAGVAAARGGNGIGVTGAAPRATFSGHKVRFQIVDDATLAAATEFKATTSQGVHLDIKNHSYSATFTYLDQPLRAAAFESTAAAGVINVAAAGNSRNFETQDSTKLAMQNSPHVITVAALGAAGIHSGYSSFGACVTVAAPSSGPASLLGTVASITTTDREGDSGYNASGDTENLDDRNYTAGFGGTSSSSPLVAGVLALVKQAQPNLDARFAKHLLARHSDLVDPSNPAQLGEEGWQTNAAGIKFNPSYGFGLINAGQLTTSAQAYLGVTPLITTFSGTEFSDRSIPDGTGQGSSGQPLVRTFEINSNDPLEEVLVKLDITHPKQIELSAYLTSPSGTRHRIFSHNPEKVAGSPTADIDWTYTVNGFWGEDPDGTWTLEIFDNYLNQIGTLNSFSVTCRQGRLLTPHGLNLLPNPVVGGLTAQGNVTLNSPAQAGGQVVSLVYEGPISGPASVTVPAGQSNAVFVINTQNVSTPTDAFVTADMNGAEIRRKLNLRKLSIQEITVSPDPVPNATNAIGTVVLNAPATSPTVVPLTFSPSNRFAVSPSSVTIPTGSSQAQFSFRSEAYNPGFTATVTGVLNGLAWPEVFEVAPILLEGTFIYPFNAYTGQKVFGVVRLASAQPSDTVVTVNSSNTGLIGSRQVTVPAGQTFAVFPLTIGLSSSLDRFTTVTLTSSTGSELRSDPVIVRPPTNALASGYNLYYSVGDGLTRNREFFSIVDGPESIYQVVSSANASLLLRSDGTVWSVGQGTFGQHGDGTVGVGAIKPRYVQVPGLSGIKQISANGPTVLALDSAGEVWGWGQNNVGQAGSPGGGNISVPTKIVGLANIATVASGAFASFALDNNGGLWSWGSNASGASGRPTSGHAPLRIPGAIGPFVALGVGNQHAFAIHADGSLFGWGLNTSGQLGDGTLINRLSPTFIPNEGAIRQIAGGLEHSVALRVLPHGGNRNVRTTGRNTHGQRGDGSVASNGNLTNTWANIASGSNITEIAAGNRHGFYIGSATIRSWGYGANGERADGSFVTSKSTPGPLPETISASNVLASSANSAALAAVRSFGRSEALLVNSATRTLMTANFRTNTSSNISGTYPVGHTVVGGGDVGGSTSVNEVVTMDSSRTLHYQSITGTTLGSSTSTGISLLANESLAFVANMDAASRMDFVTVNSNTKEVRARLWNGTAQTGIYSLYTLANNESLTGVGDMNLDGHQDLVIFNSATRLFSVRLYRNGILQGTTSIVNAPLTPTAPAPIPALAAGFVPFAAAEARTGYGYEMVFINASGAFEVWDLSRLNRVTMGLQGPTIPVGFAPGPFWR